MKDMNRSLSKREHILNAGLTVMRERGYNGTGVKDIVEAAGVPKGSFYNYFASKEAFAIEALQQVAAGNLVQMRRTLGDSTLSPLARFEAFFARNIEHLKRTQQFTGGCFVGTICQEVADTNSSIRKVAEELLSEYEDVFFKCLSDAKKQKELASSISVGGLASFIFSAWEGALLKMKASKSAVPLELFLDELVKLLRLCSQ